MRRYIAVEEAFTIPELAARQPKIQARIRNKPSFAREWALMLPDIANYRIPEMDAHGVDIQVLSLSVPGIQIDSEKEMAVANAEFANNYLADVIDRHPDRFRGFAALPLQDPARAIIELERCVANIGFCGALVNDHTRGAYLDHPDFDDVWSALEELDVPLYIHPGSNPLDDWAVMSNRPEMYGASWSWQAEVGGHAMRLIYGGIFDRHPKATLILGHLGEFLPFQQSRFDSRYQTLSVQFPLQHAPSEYFKRNIKITTSGILAPQAIEAAVNVIGADSIMFAVDYPYERTSEAVAALDTSTLSDSDKNKIAHENARRVLRLAI